ncbi:hypothetical protein AGMMS49936_11130 [Endomicrobiia bacterium]|nr:hypothetical protein AGMMS49936_11130 [Endomicrobiia bacterium]
MSVRNKVEWFEDSLKHLLVADTNNIGYDYVCLLNSNINNLNDKHCKYILVRQITPHEAYEGGGVVKGYDYWSNKNDGYMFNYHLRLEKDSSNSIKAIVYDSKSKEYVFTKH